MVVGYSLPAVQCFVTTAPSTRQEKKKNKYRKQKTDNKKETTKNQNIKQKPKRSKEKLKTN